MTIGSSFEEDVLALYQEAYQLLLKKHKDYGPKNISEAPGGALNGLLVRMHDKMARLKHLTYNKPGQTPNYESVEDTFIDIANYAIIGLMVLQGKWEKEHVEYESNDVLLNEAKKIWSKNL